MKSFIPLLLPALFLCMPAPCIRADTSPATVPDQTTLEKQLSKKLTNARLSGFYSMEGQEGPPQQDQYTLAKVAKGEGDKWQINARIQYGKKSIMLPLEIPVLWAGDTAVISLTHMTLPGLGTFTARVLIHGDYYAGAWDGGDHKGYLWGRIQHIATNPNGKVTEEKPPGEAPPEK